MAPEDPALAGFPRRTTRRLVAGASSILATARGLLAFALITLGVMVTKARSAPRVLRPLIVEHVVRSGFRLLPMVLFLSAALGLVVIGQSVSLLTRVGANAFLGTIMVTAVVRELGPLVTALIVLSRTGTAYVVELGTARATGEIEALESMGIDPVHYFVVPRVIGMALGVFSLTLYFIIGALLSGYLWAFVQDVPLQPDEYFRQLAEALTGLDFVLLALKAIFFGAALAIVTCYHGLARPLHLVRLSQATVSAVAQSISLCVLIDTLFLVLYLVT